jgi:hypothetical protein
MGSAGLWDWDVLRLRTRMSMRIPAPEVFGGPGVWSTVCVVRLAAGMAAPGVLVVSPRAAGLALLVIALTTLVMMYRMMYGLDGSDQLTAVLALTGGAALLLGTGRALVAFCWFVVALMCVAYVTAGMTKATSATWRSGRALHVVMRTEVYGRPALAGLARGPVGVLATRAVIATELAYPLVFLGSPAVTVGVLSVLVAFHLSTAVVMGLNCFLPVYVCTVGCALWCSTQGW